MKTPIKLIGLVNILAIAAICVVNYIYQSHRFPFKLKCLCSAVFATLAVFNLACFFAVKSENRAFQIAMTAGAVAAFLGDVFIHSDFIKGAAVFAVGHLCFLAAYFLLQNPRPLDFILGGIIFLTAAAVLHLCPILHFNDPQIKFACFAYALIISFMLGKSLGNVILGANALTAVLAAGSALFFISDLMLVFHIFSNGCRWANNACAATYYPAMCLMVLSMFIKIAL